MLARRISFFIMVFVVSVTASAQKDVLEFSQLTTADGLTHSNVTCVFQDSHGFMWFGTEDGLNRYDGYHLISYKREAKNKFSISNNYIKDIVEDASGDLWIATMGGGLNRYDRNSNRFTQFRNKIGDSTTLSNDFIADLMMDHKGRIWMSTSKGLNVFDPKTYKFKSYYHRKNDPRSLSEDQTTYVFQDSRNRVWIATAAKGLDRFDETSDGFVHFTHDPAVKNSLSGNKITTLFEDSRNNFWVGTVGNGLNLMDPVTGKCKVFLREKNNPNSLCNNVIFSIAEDDEKNLWIGSENGGISIYNPFEKTFHTYESNELDNTTLSSSAVNSVYKDHQGNIWIATYNAGVNYITKKMRTFDHYRHTTDKGSLSSSKVLSIMEDSRQNLWVGTDGGGLNRLDRKTNKFIHYIHREGDPKTISGNHVLTIIEDSEHNIWTGTWGNGISVFNPRTNSYKHLFNIPSDSNTISGNNVWVIYEDSDKYIWIAAQEKGLDRYEPKTGKIKHYSAELSGLSSNSFISMFQDRNGTLWVGTAGSGLNTYDRKTDRFIPFIYEDIAADNTPNSMLEDDKGNFWIATNGGLLLLNRKTNVITPYHVADGLPGEVIYGMLEDRQGHLWLSTNKGVSEFDPQRKTFRNFDVSDGLQSNEFKTACWKSSSGKMYFGGNNGFNEFFPDSIPVDSYEPRLVFTDFQIFNKSVEISMNARDQSPLKKSITETKDITLPHGSSVISFEFAALDYSSPEKKRYAYQMEGFDVNWNDAGTKHMATYTNLDPGSYTFKVATMTADGKWSTKPAMIRLTITPPFWLTWWFKVASLLAIVGGVSGFFRYRMSMIKHQKKVLETQVIERTAQLALLSEQERKARKEAEKARNEAQHANKAKSVFLATMSHEIRTPMNGVIGMASLLTKTQLSPDQRTYAETISTCGDALLTVINDILDFSKIESGHLDLEHKAFDLRICIEEVLDVFANKAAQTGIDLIYDIDKRVPTLIMGDSLRLRQVLINLVSNATKFTHQGEIVVEVALVEEKDDKELKLAFRVRDTGIGIPADKIHKLFRAFSQVDSSTTRKYGGTGLGLVISENLVRLMRGTMEVTSTPGEGSTFSFTMVTSRVLTSVSRPAHTNMKVLEGKRVLVVDDNKTNRIILQKQLAEWKMETVLACSGKEALDFIRDQASFDLVITDMQMPEMDGIELGMEIRSLHADLPIVLLSSVGDIRSKDLNHLFNSTITKPIKQLSLLDHLIPAVTASGVHIKSSREPEQSTSTQLSTLYPMNILVAEDNIINQLLVQKMLATLGYEPVVVQNGREAVDRVKDESFDLILMDVQMPVMDGFEATKEIRLLPGTQPVIIATTANAMQGDEADCRNAGMDDYLSKPIKVENLRKLILRWGLEFQMRSVG